MVLPLAPLSWFFSHGRILGHRFINYDFLWAFLLASLGYGVLVNVFAVLLGAWRFRFRLADQLQRDCFRSAGAGRYCCC